MLTGTALLTGGLIIIIIIIFIKTFSFSTRSNFRRSGILFDPDIVLATTRAQGLVQGGGLSV